MRLAFLQKPLSPWLAWVLLLVGILVPIVAFFPTGALPVSEAPVLEEVKRLAREYSHAHAQGNWSLAIEKGRRLNTLQPDNPTHQYNLACAFALNKELDTAADWLGKAVANGFSRLRLFENDPDLAELRSHPEYEAALAVVKKNRAEELADLRAKFEATPLHVVLPPGYREDQASPLIVALHGRGARAAGMADEWRGVAAEMGAIVIAPQAVVPVGRGFSWNAADSLDYLCDHAEFLVRWTVASAMKKYRIDPERTILTGFSQGGFVAQIVGPRPPHLFAGVIPMGCGYVREYDLPPPPSGDRPPRFYFMAGEMDAMPAETLHLARQDYAEAGYESEARIYPGVGHRFPIDRDAELRTALDFVLQR